MFYVIFRKCSSYGCIDLYTVSYVIKTQGKLYFFFFAEKHKQIDAAGTADANRSTSGTDCSRTTRITTVRVYSWTGSYFPLAAYVDAILSTVASSPHLMTETDLEIDIEIDKLQNMLCKQ